MKRGIKYWLRWIGILPISLLAGMLSSFPLHWILKNTLSNSYSPLITPYPELPERILTPFAIALTFVWVSSWVAPEHKFKTAILFAVIWIFGVVSIFVLIHYGIILGNSQITLPVGVLPAILGVVGAIVGIIYVRKNLNEEVI